MCRGDGYHPMKPKKDSLNELQLTNILYQAKDSEIGLILRTNNIFHLRTYLYQVQKKIPDEGISELTFTISPVKIQTDLWVIKPRFSRGLGRGKKKREDKYYA
jgi:hypothetical protein